MINMNMSMSLANGHAYSELLILHLLSSTPRNYLLTTTHHKNISLAWDLLYFPLVSLGIVNIEDAVVAVKGVARNTMMHQAAGVT